MKKIGKEVCFIYSDDTYFRNGEGGFVRLKDGGILYAYTAFTGGASDHSASVVRGVLSEDEGESWQDMGVLLEPDEGATNYMDISLMRMQNGDIGLFYVRKDTQHGYCQLFLRRSADEGRTWSEATPCFTDNGFDVTNNDRVVRLSSGRLLAPYNRHEIFKPFVSYGRGQCNFFASDDDGRTWKKLLDENLDIPFGGSGLQETGVYQRQDGTIWAWSRTDLFCQYEYFSQDDGATWTTPAPSRFFSSPNSPMQVKRAGKYTLAVWNPIPNYTTRITNEAGRTPLVCGVSEDDGRTFPRIFAVEDDPDNSYCYPALLEGKDYVLLAYYHSYNRTGWGLNCNKIVKIGFDELA